jgi:hypothetical protein
MEQPKLLKVVQAIMQWGEACTSWMMHGQSSASVGEGPLYENCMRFL